MREHIDRICIDSDLEKFYLTYNLGVSTDTSERLLGRLDTEVAARMLESGEPYLIFSIGTNDSIWLKKEERYWVELEAFKVNIRALIKKAKRYSDKIVFLGSLPVDESKTRPYHNDADLQSSNQDIKEYEVATESVCKEEGVDFVPVFVEASEGNYLKLLFNDGIHPNDVGHAYLFEKIWDYIKQAHWLEP